MLKVNEFERDAEYRQHRNKIYRRDAVETYRYDGTLSEILGDYDFISKCISHHLEAQVPRLQMLDDYYQGLNYNIMRNRRRRKTLSR